jgi:DNA-binding NtrC family response regulator
VSVRFLAATNANPGALLGDGALRKDLYYRLRGCEISLPDLSERREDIPLLAAHFLGHEAAGIRAEAVDALARADWPGHIRQLRNVVRSARAAAGESKIRVRHLALDRGADAQPVAEPSLGKTPRGETLKDLERQAILQALEDSGGSRIQAARLLDIDRSTLRRKLREYAE